MARWWTKILHSSDIFIRFGHFSHRVFCVLCMLCLCCRACWRADRSACWAKGSCRQGGSCDGGWGNRGPSDFALQTSMASSNTKSAWINGINSEICTNWSPSWWAPNTWCLMSQHTSTSTVETLNGTTEWQKSFKTKKAQPGPNRSRHRGMIWKFELLLSCAVLTADCFMARHGAAWGACGGAGARCQRGGRCPGLKLLKVEIVKTVKTVRTEHLGFSFENQKISKMPRLYLNLAEPAARTPWLKAHSLVTWPEFWSVRLLQKGLRRIFCQNHNSKSWWNWSANVPPVRRWSCSLSPSHKSHKSHHLRGAGNSRNWTKKLNKANMTIIAC